MTELPSVALVLTAAIVAGSLGALLGLGGGVFLIPLLNGALGIPHGAAAALSLVAVIGTSTSVSIASSSRPLVNTRLAMVLALLSVWGATLGNVHLDDLTDFWFKRIFGATTLVVAAVMLARLGRRNVLTGEGIDIGTLGGRFHENESGGEVSYRVRRLPIALAASFASGILSTLIGVGGGMVIVPVLNSWCGVPLRAAAATSAFLIGVTAVPGVIGHYRLGYLTLPALGAAAVIGVFIGARGGLWVSARAPVRSMKTLMAAILAAVGTWYFFFK